MSPFGRAFLGAAIGALITLCIHPTSRPFMMGVTSRASPGVLWRCVDSNTPVLDSPRTLSEASLWMQLAAHKISGRERLTSKELSTILSIAKLGEEREPTNAFWPEMQAIAYIADNRVHEATTAWIRASSCSQWNDYQTARLKRARTSISEITAVRQSWQLAYLYYARSDDVTTCLLPVARTILANSDFESVGGLTLRYATMLNGDLLRDHVHSTKSSITAMEIVWLATYPSEKVGENFLRPKMLWAGRNKILTNLTVVAHEPDWTQRAKKIFNTNESWQALTVHDSNDEQTELFAIGAVLCSSVASAGVVVSVVGVLIWLTGRLVAWRLARAKDIKPVVAVAIAVALGSAVDLLTGYLPAALAVALCASFLTVAPDRSRKARPSDLGPLFAFMAMLLGLICSAMFMMYLIGTTPAANAVFPNLGVPSEYFDRPLMAGIAAVTFGLVLLIAPIWAVVHRIGTPHVLSLTLMRFGIFVSVMGLSLSIVLGPLSVYADRRLETTFTELVNNEPLHYYLNR